MHANFAGIVATIGILFPSPLGVVADVQVEMTVFNGRIVHDANAPLGAALLLGALAMLPSWWHQRRRASRATRRLDKSVAEPPPKARVAPAADTGPDTVMPPPRPDGI